MSLFFYEDLYAFFGVKKMDQRFQNFTATVMLAASNTPCGGGDSEAANCQDESQAFPLKMIAIVSILFSGIIGVGIPLVGKKIKLLSIDSVLFLTFKAFAAGVILATGFVHMLPDGEEALTDPCLPKFPWSNFPFSGFVAMMASLVTLLADILGTQFYTRKHQKEVENARVESGDDGHLITDDERITVTVGPTAEETNDDDNWRILSVPVPDEACHSTHVRSVVVSQIMEFGIVSHSVIIGLSLGLSHSPCTIRPLIAALSFHQFFEGFALGSCISQAQFSNVVTTIMAAFFSLTTPLGIGVGTFLGSFYNADSPRSLIVEGVFDCVSAGILIYMALVDLVAADFLSGNMSSNSSASLKFYSFLALFLGAGFMSLLALWA